MLFLKSCPKCKGDMYLDRDTYGTFKECLQCGNIVDVERARQLTKAIKKRMVS